ncbi:hypothetical protein N408_08710 [Helicobacter pylori FD703]|nr:hypothetical protein N408_08710 [Helicobacter pylori FD703]
MANNTFSINFSNMFKLFFKDYVFFKPLIIANFKKPIKMTDTFFLVRSYGLIVLKAVLIFLYYNPFVRSGFVASL